MVKELPPKPKPAETPPPKPNVDAKRPKAEKKPAQAQSSGKSRLKIEAEAKVEKGSVLAKTFSGSEMSDAMAARIAHLIDIEPKENHSELFFGKAFAEDIKAAVRLKADGITAEEGIRQLAKAASIYAENPEGARIFTSAIREIIVQKQLDPDVVVGSSVRAVRELALFVVQGRVEEARAVNVVVELKNTLQELNQEKWGGQREMQDVREVFRESMEQPEVALMALRVAVEKEEEEKRQAERDEGDEIVGKPQQDIGLEEDVVLVGKGSATQEEGPVTDENLPRLKDQVIFVASAQNKEAAASDNDAETTAVLRKTHVTPDIQKEFVEALQGNDQPELITLTARLVQETGVEPAENNAVGVVVAKVIEKITPDGQTAKIAKDYVQTLESEGSHTETAHQQLREIITEAPFEPHTNELLVDISAVALKAADPEIADSVNWMVQQVHERRGVTIDVLAQINAELQTVNQEAIPEVLHLYGSLLRMSTNDPETVKSYMDFVEAVTNKNPDVNKIRLLSDKLDELRKSGKLSDIAQNIIQSAQGFSGELVDWRYSEPARTAAGDSDGKKKDRGVPREFETIEELNDFIDLYERRKDTMHLDSRQRILDDTLRAAGVSRKLNDLEYNNAVARIDRLYMEVNEEIKKMSTRREFSSIYLTPESIDEFLENPHWMIERFIRRVEETAILFSGDTPTGRAAEQRLSLFSDYFSSDEFRRAVYERAKLKPDPDKYLKQFEKVYQDLSTTIAFRRQLLVAFGVYRATGEPKSISEQLRTFGEKGIGIILNENGGLAERAFNKYCSNLYSAVYNPNDGTMRRIEARVLKEVFDETVNELWSERKLHDKKIASAFGKRKIEIDGQKVEAGGLIYEDCEAVVRLAKYLAAITERDGVAIWRGKGPAESQTWSDLSSFASASATEKVLAAWDMDRFFFEKWTNLDIGKMVMWDTMCEMAGRTSGRSIIVDEFIKTLNRKELIMEAFGFKLDGKTKVINEGAIKKYLMGEERRKLINIFEWDKMNKVKGGIKPSELLTDAMIRRKLLINQGKRIVGTTLYMYDHYTSGWRLGEHLKHLKEMFGVSKKNPDGSFDTHTGYGDLLGLGMQLRQAASSVLDAESHAVLHESLGGLKSALNKISRFRPQLLFQFLADEGNPDSVNSKDIRDKTAWFNRMKSKSLLSKKGLGEKIVRPDHLLKFVDRHFININEQLADGGLPPIDYRSGPSTRQRRVVERVCKALGTKTEGYLRVMQELTLHTGDVKQIETLVHPRYWTFYERTLVVDDIRRSKMERPETAPGVMAVRRRKKKLIPYSEVIAEDGLGVNESLPRTWSDTDLAVQAVQAVFNTLSPNKEEYFKNLKIIFDAIKIYNGSMPKAARAVVYLMDGWGQTAQTSRSGIFSLDWVLAGDLPRGSAMKRLFGEHADSLSINEIWHWVEQHHMVLAANIEDMAPELTEYMLKDLGISWDGPMSHLPLYVFRGRLLGYMIAAILIASSASAALGAIGAAKQESSH